MLMGEQKSVFSWWQPAVAEQSAAHLHQMAVDMPLEEGEFGLEDEVNSTREQAALLIDLTVGRDVTSGGGSGRR
jgi:hypothetical protein